MSSPKPPLLAIWLLEHFVFGGNHEALAGDLLEEFRRRSSRAWYWRQVLFAIVLSFSEELRRHWVAASAAILLGSAGVRMSSTKFLNGRQPEWTADPARVLEFIPQLRSLWRVQARLDWPESLIYQMAFLAALDTITLSFALGSFLLLTRKISPRSFMRGLFVALPVLVAGRVSSAFLSAAHVPRLLGYISLWLPMLLGLALSICTARVYRSKDTADQATAE